MLTFPFIKLMKRNENEGERYFISLFSLKETFNLFSIHL